MAKTYLDVINITLRDLNELPMTLSEFGSPRGIQAAVKEMVNRAYADILNYSKEWPFLNEVDPLMLTVQTVEGVQEYSFPAGLDSIDWDSFYVVRDGTNLSQSLSVVDIDFYTRHMKRSDTLSDGGGIPSYVYRLKNNSGFGVSPIPDDQDYTITYSAWRVPTLLVNEFDEIIIPERYYNVLVARTRYYLWMFRENPQHASFAIADYERGLKQMHRDLVEKQSIRMKLV